MPEIIRGIDFDMPAYGLGDIIPIDGRSFLSIELAKTRFALPLVKIPGTLNAPPMAIAWFNPNHKDNFQLANAASIATVATFDQRQADYAFYTNSSKSMYFIEAAARILGLQLILLPSGDKESEVKGRSENGRVTHYKPVTGTDKFMTIPKGLTAKDLEQIREGRSILFDDVRTTGKTLDTMREVLGLTPESDCTELVVAVERPLGRDYLAVLPKNLLAAFVIPEIDLTQHPLDPNSLYSIEHRQDIPKAILLR